MTDLTVVENMFAGGELKCQFQTHPNVALKQKQGTYTFQGDITQEIINGTCTDEASDTQTETINAPPDVAPRNEMGIVAANKLENLEPYLKTVKLNDTARIILLQIAHAVHHIHEQGWCHGEIKKRNLRVSESRKKIVLVQLTKVYSKDRPANDETKKNDIKALIGIFRIILSRSKVKDAISDHLSESMEKDVISTSTQLLQHPYFWNTNKKLAFLAAVAQRSKGKSLDAKDIKGRLNAHTCAEILSSDNEKMSEEGWICHLVITKDEKTKIDEHLKEYYPPENAEQNENVNNSIRRVGRRKIFKLAKSNIYTNYSSETLYDLVNFIRNFWEHFWQQDNDVKACFNSDPFEGYWAFFNRRFPKLFQVVYDELKRKTEKTYEDPQMEFYFEALSKNEDLPVKQSVSAN